QSCGLSDISRNIPTWGITYCLVVGRRKRMDDISNQMRGQIQYERGDHIITYDRLVDNILKLGNGFQFVGYQDIYIIGNLFYEKIPEGNTPAFLLCFFYLLQF